MLFVNLFLFISPKINIVILSKYIASGLFFYIILWNWRKINKFDKCHYLYMSIIKLQLIMLIHITVLQYYDRHA